MKVSRPAACTAVLVLYIPFVTLLVSESPPVKCTVQAHVACFTVFQIRDPRLVVSSHVHIKVLVDFSSKSICIRVRWACWGHSHTNGIP